MGLNHIEIYSDNRTRQPLLVATLTPGASSAPGSLVSVVSVQGGTGRLALERSVKGGPAGSESLTDTLSPTLPAPATGGTYLAFYEDSSTELTVKSLDGNGDVVETLIDNVTIPAGAIDADRPGISRISGDTTLPDDSFTIHLGEKYYAVNISTGAFTELFDDGATEDYSRGGVYYDTTTQLVYIATWYEETELEAYSCRLRSVATDGTGLTLINTDTLSPPDRYDDPFGARATTVYQDDRAIQFFEAGSGSWTGCTEIPFDGSSVVARSGDTPSTTTGSAVVISAGDGYHVQQDGTSTNWLGYTMPKTTGDASSLGWPSGAFFVGEGEAAVAALIGDDLVMWPVKTSAGGTDAYLLRIEKDTVPGLDDLIQVSSATTSPIGPYAVIPTS